MYLTVRAIVLRVTDFNDRDALLTVLTQNYGKLTIKARGLRRKNSPLVAPCQLLAYGEFTLFEYRGKYTINEAHALELFQGLPAGLGQRQVRAAAVAVLQVGLGIAVTNQVESAHFSRCSRPQKIRWTLSAFWAKYWQTSPVVCRHRRMVASMGTTPQKISMQIITLSDKSCPFSCSIGSIPARTQART